MRTSSLDLWSRTERKLAKIKTTACWTAGHKYAGCRHFVPKIFVLIWSTLHLVWPLIYMTAVHWVKVNWALAVACDGWLHLRPLWCMNPYQHWINNGKNMCIELHSKILDSESDNIFGAGLSFHCSLQNGWRSWHFHLHEHKFHKHTDRTSIMSPLLMRSHIHKDTSFNMTSFKLN